MPKTKNTAIWLYRALVVLGGAIAACAVGGVFTVGLTGVADKAENEEWKLPG